MNILFYVAVSASSQCPADPRPPRSSSTLNNRRNVIGRSSRPWSISFLDDVTHRLARPSRSVVAHVFLPSGPVAPPRDELRVVWVRHGVRSCGIWGSCDYVLGSGQGVFVGGVHVTRGETKILVQKKNKKSKSSLKKTAFVCI